MILRKTFIYGFIFVAFVSCSNTSSASSNDDDDDDRDTYNEITIIPSSFTADAGRVLGSQCAQCHGTNGVSVSSFDSIRGEDDLHDEMFEDEHPIMKAQAQGYTSTEIQQIQTWLDSL